MRISDATRSAQFLAALILFGGLARSATAAPESKPPAKRSQSPPTAVTTNDVEMRWGVRISGVRTSANGWMLDFRYHVVDPEKAKPLGKNEFKPYLVDQKTGTKLLVPNTPKVGPLRQMSKNPQAGRDYWMLFSNPGQVVKPGAKVTVVIGDFRIEDLTVE